MTPNPYQHDEADPDTRADYELQQVERYYRGDNLMNWPELRDLWEETVLNIGCGRAESIQRYPTWEGCDFNRNLQPLWNQLGIGERCHLADAANLPFMPGMFDYTVSCDFFEHLPTSMIKFVAEELRRIAPKGVHVIHMVEQSSNRGVRDRNLHLSGHVTAVQWSEYLDCPVVETGRTNHLIARWGE